MKRCGPSCRHTRNASAVFKIFVLHPKKTFATVSALFGHGAMSELSPPLGVKRKSVFGAVRAAFDPQETSAGSGCPAVTGAPAISSFRAEPWPVPRVRENSSQRQK